MNPDLLRGHVEGLLLAVLTDAPGHGYELSQRLSERSGGQINVPEGSLYPALQRLEGRGQARSAWVSSSGRRRRVYTLSRAGRRQAARAATEWRDFSTAVDRVLGGLA